LGSQYSHLYPGLPLSLAPHTRTRCIIMEKTHMLGSQCYHLYQDLSRACARARSHCNSHHVRNYVRGDPKLYVVFRSLPRSLCTRACTQCNTHYIRACTHCNTHYVRNHRCWDTDTVIYIQVSLVLWHACALTLTFENVSQV